MEGIARLLLEGVPKAPFVAPLPVWDYWYLLLLPLVAAVAIVYKAIRCGSMRQVPREAAILFVVILLVMVLAAGALAGLVTLLEW